MFRITRGRVAATLTTAALAIAAAVATAAPVQAAEPINEYTAKIVLENDTYTYGDWGSGIFLQGSGFEPGIAVRIYIGDELSVFDRGISVTPDASGAFTVTNWIPKDRLPQANPYGALVTIHTIQDLTTDPDQPRDRRAPVVPLYFVPAEPEPEPKPEPEPSAAVTPASVPVSVFKDDKRGVTLSAEGFEPGETVTVELQDAAGKPVDINTLDVTADANGNLSELIFGDGTAGKWRFALTGATSGTVVYASFTLTADATTPSTPVSPSDPSAPPAAMPDDTKELADTGTDANGLWIGCALLALGATLMVIRRARLAAH